MAELQWKHGSEASKVKQIVQGKLAENGYGDKVEWSGNNFSASVGWGTILSLKGRITKTEIVIENCGGVASGKALSAIKSMLKKAFPDGEV